jgi:hypothetical protein
MQATYVVNLRDGAFSRKARKKTPSHELTMEVNLHDGAFQTLGVPKHPKKLKPKFFVKETRPCGRA